MHLGAASEPEAPVLFVLVTLRRNIQTGLSGWLRCRSFRNPSRDQKQNFSPTPSSPFPLRTAMYADINTYTLATFPGRSSVLRHQYLQNFTVKIWTPLKPRRPTSCFLPAIPLSRFRLTGYGAEWKIADPSEGIFIILRETSCLEDL